MDKAYKSRDAILAIICIMLFFSLKLTKSVAKISKDPLYDTKIKAYEHMEKCMGEVRKIKHELGIPMAQEDFRKTGMIGEMYSPITTSLGSIEAKRTSTNPDMAALVVDLLYKAGVKKGDKIGANLSGSFPAMNIALLSACEAMGIKYGYISSIGASNFGANNEKLSFPDIAYRLWKKGLIENPGEAFSVGGTDDLGEEMDKMVLSSIVNRLKLYGLKEVEFKDYESNLIARQKLIESRGRISAFVSIGGNITSLGRGESSFYIGQGLIVGKIMPITEESGLIEIYRNKEMPVIQLLNLKKLTADYGVAYDPTALPKKGTSALYIKPSYNLVYPLTSISVAVLGLICYRKKGSEEN